MKKSQWNFIVDALMFLCMATMTGKGLLIRYVLIPGKDRWAKYGSNVELELFGWDRHEWGTIHLYVAYTLLALMVLHIVLHWNMIPAMYKKLIAGRAARWVVGVAFLGICFLFTAFPLFVKPEVLEAGRGEGRGHGKGALRQGGTAPAQLGQDAKSAVELAEPRDEHGARPLGIRGSMTVGEVSDRYGVPIDYLTSGLGIREKVTRGEKLGWLRKRYDFTMRDVEAVIEKYQKSK